ncbi:MAG: serine/threonine protein kinase [Fibrobacteres bacterium]|nr:serine/threonine protein kinase [Fibrobacterota bacterium]
MGQWDHDRHGNLALSHPGKAGRRRHGCGAHGRRLRFAPVRGRENAAPRSTGRHRPATIPSGSHHCFPPGAFEHRAGPRHGRTRRWRIFGDGIFGSRQHRQDRFLQRRAPGSALRGLRGLAGGRRPDGRPRRRRVVHRDVKPDNLLISRQGVVKVADFGIARLQNDVHRTAPGVAIGSPHYMAPEQAEGQESSPKTDVFALAGVLHFMVCGRPPFEAENVMGLLYRITSHDAPELRMRSHECPRALSELVRAMHQRDPDRRPTMAEVSERLRSWLADHGILQPSEHLRATLGFPQTTTLRGNTTTAAQPVEAPLRWWPPKRALASIASLALKFLQRRAAKASR